MKSEWSNLRCASVLAVTVLSACATPAPKVQVVTKSIPVPTACIAASSVPSMPPSITLAKDARTAAAQATAQAMAYKGFAEELLALIGPCEK